MNNLPTSQQTNDDDKYVIYFGNLSLNDPATAHGHGDSVPSSSQVSNGPSAGEFQNVFDMNYEPAGNSNGGLNSFYPPIDASPIHDQLLRNHNTNVHQGHHNYWNLGLGCLPPPPLPANIQQREGPLAMFNLFKMAISPDSSEQLRRILKQGKYVRETLMAALPLITLLMTDNYGHRIFEVLMEKCEIYDLYALVERVVAEGDSFILAAFENAGSRSIQRFIKKLKNTGLENIITERLSKFAWDLMTHKIASHVIKQCFHVLGEGPNKVLHDFVLENFLPLALDPMGCITINQCIDCITGGSREKLLHMVAYNASQLSYDPSGNFVVQHVLELNNNVITQGICFALKGHFVQLAQKKHGSHVVERCLKSDVGRVTAVEEIFKNEKTVSMVAGDQFGNYAIQTALKEAMMHDRYMYIRLVQALEPSHSKIVQKVNSQFSDDVIQAALKEAMMHDRYLYKRLVQALKPSHSKIVQKMNSVCASRSPSYIQ